MSEQRTQVLIPTLKAGTYAVSTVNYIPWLETPVSALPGKVRKSKGTSKVVNEIFAQCAELTTDPYWISIFNQAAIGKMPKKFSYNNGILSYKRSTKVESREIPQSPIEAISVCINFFRTYGGLASEAEQKMIQNEIDPMICQAPQTWAKTKKKMKEVMVEHFVERRKAAMNLTEKEARQLHQTIKFGLVLKLFHKDNISVAHNRIVDIEGLRFNAETREFYCDPNLTAKVSRSRQVDSGPEIPKAMTVNFAKQWAKLLEGLEKEAAKATEPRFRILNQTVVDNDGHDETM